MNCRHVKYITTDNDNPKFASYLPYPEDTSLLDNWHEVASRGDTLMAGIAQLVPSNKNQKEALMLVRKALMVVAGAFIAEAD